MHVKGVEGGKSYSRRERFVDTWLLKHGSWVCIGTDATPFALDTIQTLPRNGACSAAARRCLG